MFIQGPYCFSFLECISSLPTFENKLEIPPNFPPEMKKRLLKKDHFVKAINLQGIHPRRLTWNIIMEVWKIMFLSKWVICRFHVNLPGCMLRKSTSPRGQQKIMGTPSPAFVE